MCLYWPIALVWGSGKIKKIRMFNNGLNEKLASNKVAPDVPASLETGAGFTKVEEMTKQTEMTKRRVRYNLKI